MEAPTRGRGRVPGGIVVGVLLAIPLGLLLSYAAFLVAMLGLFYFVLFGLLIGGAIYRVWLPLRPLAPRTVKLGVAVAVLAGWGGSLVWEGLTFPSQVAKDAIKQVVKLPEKTDPEVRADDVRSDAARAARRFLAERYPPGGVIGYWRWAMAEKTIAIPITGATNPRPLRYRTNGGMFMARVILSGLAFTLAVYSQVAPLSRPAPSTDHPVPEVILRAR
ncbi:MAG: hypothetical protein V2A79_15050 [Planctomycetota bacterium]